MQTTALLSPVRLEPSLSLLGLSPGAVAEASVSEQIVEPSTQALGRARANGMGRPQARLLVLCSHISAPQVTDEYMK